MDRLPEFQAVPPCPRAAYHAGGPSGSCATLRFFSVSGSSLSRRRGLLIGVAAALCVVATAGEVFGQRWVPDRRPDRVQKNLPPTAHAGGNVTGVAGEPVTFDASQSYDPDGWIKEYTWDFGDGTTGRGRTTTHVYETSGDYAATLYVKDNGLGDRDPSVSSAIITVTPPGGTETLKADFRVYKLVSVDPVDGTEEWVAIDLENEEIELGLRVKFDASTSSGSAAYFWTYLEVTNGNGEKVLHAFEHPGAYNVTLTVYNAAWTESDTITQTIHVGRGMESLSIMPWVEEGYRPTSFTLDGTDLWAVTLSGKLGVVDISDPYDLPALEIVATEDIDESDVLASANRRLFVGRQQAGVDIYSADQDAFTLIGYLTPEDLNAYGAAFVGAVGDTLYVGTMSPYELQVYDVSHLDSARSPSTPTYKSAIPVDDGIIAGWQIAGGALVVRNCELKLTVVDIREPFDPTVATVLDAQTNWISRAGTAGNMAYASTPNGTKIWELIIPEHAAEPIEPALHFSFDADTFPLGVFSDRLYVQQGDAAMKYNVVDRARPYWMDAVAPNGNGMFDGFVFVPSDPALPAEPVLIVGTNTSGFTSISR